MTQMRDLLLPYLLKNACLHWGVFPKRNFIGQPEKESVPSDDYTVLVRVALNTI